MSRAGHRAKRILSVGLAVILSMCIVTLFLACEAGLGIFKKSSFMSAINKSDYQNKAYEEFVECYEDVLKANGFDTDLTEQAFTESMFRADLGGSIKASLAGKTRTVKTADETDRLKSCLLNTLADEGYKIDEPTRSAMQEIAEQVESYYRNYTRFGAGTYYYNARQQISGSLKVVIPAASVILLLCAAVLYMLNSRKRSFYRYICSALLGATLPCLYVFYRIGCAADVFSQNSGYYYDMIACLYSSSTAPLVFTELVLILGWLILYKAGKHEEQMH